MHVAFVRVTDHAGLDWMAAVAVPRATILADVSRLVELVVVVGVLPGPRLIAFGPTILVTTRSGRPGEDSRCRSSPESRSMRNT